MDSTVLQGSSWAASGCRTRFISVWTSYSSRADWKSDSKTDNSWRVAISRVEENGVERGVDWLRGGDRVGSVIGVWRLARIGYRYPIAAGTKRSTSFG